MEALTSSHHLIIFTDALLPKSSYMLKSRISVVGDYRRVYKYTGEVVHGVIKMKVHRIKNCVSRPHTLGIY